MQQQMERSSGMALSAPRRRQVDGVIRRIWGRWGWALNSDLREDCELEASLALWQLRDRLESLPEAERDAYAVACVQRRLSNFLQQECRQRARALSLEALGTEGGPAIEWAAARSDEWDAPAVGTLFDQIGRPEVAAALRSLPERSGEILDLYYGQEFTDAEIGQRLHVSPAAVKMQRHRAVARMRQLLQPAEQGAVAS
jgi:RNA polymerase sigma factor (sigma-70 family)